MQTAANPSNTSSQAVLSPLFEKKKNSRNIMSSEIAEKEREFENEHEQAEVEILEEAFENKYTYAFHM